MKKAYFFCITIAFLLSINSHAQVNLKSFVDSVDWSMKELEFTSHYKEVIDPRPHTSSPFDGTTSDFYVNGLRLGEDVFDSALYVDSLSRQLHSLYISVYFGDNEGDVDGALLSKKMDGILFPMFGQPDDISNELNSPYVKHRDRKWFCEKYIVDVSHMITSESQFYNITIKGVDNSTPDFRVAHWGDSKESIIEKEGKADLSPDDKLYMFSDNVAGFPCMVGYIFEDNKLVMARYLFNEEHTNKNDFIYDFKKLVNLLSKKYGEPDWNSPEWKNRLYQDDPSDYGFAVSIGHLVYSAGWLKDRTDISVILTGENYDITFLLQYASTKYRRLREENDMKRSLDLL